MSLSLERQVHILMRVSPMSEEVLEDINKGSTRAENAKVYQILFS